MTNNDSYRGEVRRLRAVLLDALQWLESYPPDDPSGEWEEWWYMGDVTRLDHEQYAAEVPDAWYEEQK